MRPGVTSIRARRLVGCAATLVLVCVHSQVWAQAATPSSPLAPADAPPAGVGPQLAFYGLGGGSDDCTISPGDRAGATPVSSQCLWEVGTSNPIDFLDFDPNQELFIQIRWPDGKLDQASIGSDRSITWDSMPGEPTGLYTVLAAQPGRVGSGAFAIGPATRPRYVFTPQLGAPGTEFRIGLAGFIPGQLVLLHLYRSVIPDGNLVGGNHLYLTTLGPVRIDATGQAIYSLRTSTTDRAGYYIVSPDPQAMAPAPLDDGFTITAPPGTATPGLDEQRAALVQSVVEEADRLWAAVVADNGTNTQVLDSIFGGALLDNMRADAQTLHASGQRIQARLTGPVVVVSATGPERAFAPGIPGPHAEAVVQEPWETRRVNLDGSVASTQAGLLTRRYVLDQAPDDHFWRIVEAETLPPTP